MQLGESFFLGQGKKKKTNLSPSELIEQEQQEQEDEFKKNLEHVLMEAGAQGRAIISEAEEKAAEIISNAEREALSRAQDIENQSAERGYAEGFQKGHDDGIARSKQDIADEARALDVLASAAFKVKKEIIDSAEKELLELSVVIAEKVLRQRLDTKPELLTEIIKGAIEQLQDREEIKIILNPALTESMYGFVEGLRETVKGLRNIKIIEDRTIPVDGVMVESPESRIDARIETQVKEITRNIMREFSQSSPADELDGDIN